MEGKSFGYFLKQSKTKSENKRDFKSKTPINRLAVVTQDLLPERGILWVIVQMHLCSAKSFALTGKLQFCVSWSLKIYILKYLTERRFQLLIVSYAWNRYAFILRLNSRFGVLEDRLIYFPDKKGRQVKVSCRDNAGHAQPPVSNKSFISAGRTGLGSSAMTLGQPAAAQTVLQAKLFPKS